MKGLGLSVASLHWSNLSNVMVKNMERRNTNVLLGFFITFIFTIQYKKMRVRLCLVLVQYVLVYWKWPHFLLFNIPEGLKLSLALYDDTIQASRMAL